MTDVEANAPTSPKGLARKASVPAFPSLPAPLPFRKSIRVPSDPSVAPGNLGAATPGGALGGKRTSWLMRAREVKALEITVKKPNPAPSIVPGPSGVNKRKSGDLFGVPGATGLEEEERLPKVAKAVEGDVAPMKPKTSDSAKPEPEQDMEPQPEQEGLLVQLKRTVDDLGSRFGKSMGKSLGGAAAANALAEARAAAEARLAERQHKEEEATMALGAPAIAPTRSSTEVEPSSVFHSSHSRLSVSELVVLSPENKAKGKEAEMGAPSTVAAATVPQDTYVGDKNTHTVSPPVVFHVAPAVPAPVTVFNKPPPVFVPPAPAPAPAPGLTNLASTFKMPVTTAFSKPASMALGLAPRLPSPKQTAPLSAQSTLESIRSDRLFDSQDSQDDAPAWMPSTQDTEYTSGFGSQSQCSPPREVNELDEDDSWPLSERVGGPWFGVNAKEDTSITWSTNPTQSQRRDTGPLPMPLDGDTGFMPQEETGPMSQDGLDVSRSNDRDEFRQPIPGSFHMDVDDDEYDGDREAAFDQSVLGEMEIDPSKSTVSLVEPRSQSQMSQMSQMSTASSASSQSQSQGGFLGHASKLMSSVLGTSKKGKPEVKSLQLAAIAAKKQQEEKEKKANMLKNMEARRQAQLQRKAEEEKVKAQEQERKLKEERDRLKKEREELTDKRPLPMKSVGPKKEEENGKKRKIIGEMDKKPELKKSMLKQPALNASMSSKLKTPLTKPPQTALASSATYNTASSSKLTESNLAKSQSQGKGKLPTKNMVPEDDVSQPSLILQNQMAARAKAQMQAANPTPPQIPSESIELPDINSEYSDSDDEDRPRTFDPPSWAQDPVLQQALEIQSTINPDDIFGAVRPLRMDELFRNRTGRFRARTSSANWTGTDRLTVEEEREYARRMGFR
ncbi:INCENP-ARK-bind domain-containing protein [Mycena venus]|uniref:INCENP-ARK-bind domain-containing protein n=1 Tax=Mycena venus TaxID=2733690 RepID=A0A8H6XWY0_9AGAR|nr:INCENP-ARK-bind domain-containing protein [Mycena venus]